MSRNVFVVCFFTLLLFSVVTLSAQTAAWSWAKQLENVSQTAYPKDNVSSTNGSIIAMWRIEGSCFLGYPQIDCFVSTINHYYLSKQNSDGSFIWVKQVPENIILSNLGSCDSGDVYFTGRFYGTMTLGGYTFTQTFGIFIAKLDSDGNYLWVKDISGIRIMDDFSSGVDGNCFFTGNFANTITFDDISLTCTGYSDMYISRLNPDGVWIWARQATGWRDVYGTHLAAGDSGECYLAGIANTDADFGEVYLPEAYNDYNQRFVAKYSASGVCLWVNSITRPNYYDYSLFEADLVQDGLGNAYLLYDYGDDVLDYSCIKVRKFNGTTSTGIFTTSTFGDARAKSLAIDSARNLYILGHHYEPFNVGNIPFVQNDGAVVIKLNPNYSVNYAYDPSPGIYSRYRQIGVTSDGVPYLLLASDNTYPVGDFETNPGLETASIAGLNSNGMITWIKSTWINHYGGFGTDIYQDNNGENYVCGNYQGDFFRADSLYSCFGLNGNDIYVARLTNSGQWQWTSCAGGEGNDEVSAIVSDNNQNSYITGFFTGAMHFGNITITGTGETDVFVAKLNNQGTWQWAAAYGGTGSDSGADLTLDASGNIYLTGSYTETVDFGCGTLTSAGGKDIFVLKLDNSGAPLAVSGGGGSEDDNGSGIVITPDMNVAISGNFGLNATFGSSAIFSVGDRDILVSRLDENLSWLSTATAGGTAADSASGIGTDGNGNIYITGYFTDSAQFGGINLVSNGGSDVFVAKLNTVNDWQWVQTCGSTASDKALAIAVAGDGTSYITGYTRGALHYGTHVLQSQGSQNIVCAAIDPIGDWIWAKLTGGSDSMYPLEAAGYGIAVNSGGNCSVTGRFSGYTSFTETIKPNGAYDAFVGTFFAGVGNDDSEQPATSKTVINVYPNPFVGHTSFVYTVTKSTPVCLEIYNIKGQLVKRLVRESKLAGKYIVDWDGTDTKGNRVSAGVYFYSLKTESQSVVNKLLILK